MKTLPQVVASVVTLFAASLLGAADMKPVARVMAVQEIETDDALAYSDGVARLNEAAKAKLNAETTIASSRRCSTAPARARSA